MRTREAGMCKCNIAARLLNHGCHRKAINLTYSDFVSVALVTQYAKRLRGIILLSVDHLPLLHIISKTARFLEISF
jgi:hypothetical protein